MSNKLQTLFPLIISDTDMNLLSTCQLKWFRSRCLHLSKTGFNNDLTAGAVFAKGLEITRHYFYNEDYSIKDAILLGKQFVLDEHQALINKAEEEGFIDNVELKSPERMALALETYFKYFNLDMQDYYPAIREDGLKAFEHTFTMELPINHPELNVPLIFKGKLDLIETWQGRYWGVDDKTTNKIAYNEGDKLLIQSQFIGYAYLAKVHGLDFSQFRVRKVAIQQKEIKIKEFVVPITPFILENWFNNMIRKLTNAKSVYLDYLDKFAGTVEDYNYFEASYGLGCTAYNRPCQFTQACSSKNEYEALLDIREDGLGRSPYKQTVYDKETEEKISLRDYRIKLGLDG